MAKRRRINLPISIYGNSFPIALTYGDTRAITQLQHKFVNGANRMYNKLVVPLNRYNNFAGSLHSLDVFLGYEGATQLSARGYDPHGFPSLYRNEQDSRSLKGNRFR